MVTHEPPDQVANGGTEPPPRGPSLGSHSSSSSRTNSDRARDSSPPHRRHVDVMNLHRPPPLLPIETAPPPPRSPSKPTNVPAAMMPTTTTTTDASSLLQRIQQLERENGALAHSLSAISTDNARLVEHMAMLESRAVTISRQNASSAHGQDTESHAEHIRPSDQRARSNSSSNINSVEQIGSSLPFREQHSRTFSDDTLAHPNTSKDHNRSTAGSRAIRWMGGLMGSRRESCDSEAVRALQTLTEQHEALQQMWMAYKVSHTSSNEEVEALVEELHHAVTHAQELAQLVEGAQVHGRARCDGVTSADVMQKSPTHVGGAGRVIHDAAQAHTATDAHDTDATDMVHAQESEHEKELMERRQQDATLRAALDDAACQASDAADSGASSPAQHEPAPDSLSSTPAIHRPVSCTRCAARQQQLEQTEEQLRQVQSELHRVRAALVDMTWKQEQKVAALEGRLLEAEATVASQTLRLSHCVSAEDYDKLHEEKMSLAHELGLSQERVRHLEHLRSPTRTTTTTTPTRHSSTPLKNYTTSDNNNTSSSHTSKEEEENNNNNDTTRMHNSDATRPVLSSSSTVLPHLDDTHHRVSDEADDTESDDCEVLTLLHRMQARQSAWQREKEQLQRTLTGQQESIAAAERRAAEDQQRIAFLLRKTAEAAAEQRTLLRARDDAQARVEALELQQRQSARRADDAAAALQQRLAAREEEAKEALRSAREEWLRAAQTREAETVTQLQRVHAAERAQSESALQAERDRCSRLEEQLIRTTEQMAAMEQTVQRRGGEMPESARASGAERDEWTSREPSLRRALDAAQADLETRRAPQRDAMPSALADTTRTDHRDNTGSHMRATRDASNTPERGRRVDAQTQTNRAVTTTNDMDTNDRNSADTDAHNKGSNVSSVRASSPARPSSSSSRAATARNGTSPVSPAVALVDTSSSSPSLPSSSAHPADATMTATTTHQQLDDVRTSRRRIAELEASESQLRNRARQLEANHSRLTQINATLEQHMRDMQDGIKEMALQNERTRESARAAAASAAARECAELREELHRAQARLAHMESSRAEQQQPQQHRHHDAVVVVDGEGAEGGGVPNRETEAERGELREAQARWVTEVEKLKSEILIYRRTIADLESANEEHVRAMAAVQQRQSKERAEWAAKVLQEQQRVREMTQCVQRMQVEEVNGQSQQSRIEMGEEKTSRALITDAASDVNAATTAEVVLLTGAHSVSEDEAQAAGRRDGEDGTEEICIDDNPREINITTINNKNSCHAPHDSLRDGEHTSVHSSRRDEQVLPIQMESNDDHDEDATALVTTLPRDVPDAHELQIQLETQRDGFRLAMTTAMSDNATLSARLGDLEAELVRTRAQLAELQTHTPPSNNNHDTNGSSRSNYDTVHAAPGHSASTPPHPPHSLYGPGVVDANHLITSRPPLLLLTATSAEEGARGLSSSSASRPRTPSPAPPHRSSSHPPRSLNPYTPPPPPPHSAAAAGAPSTSRSNNTTTTPQTPTNQPMRTKRMRRVRRHTAVPNATTRLLPSLLEQVSMVDGVDVLAVSANNTDKVGEEEDAEKDKETMTSCGLHGARVTRGRVDRVWATHGEAAAHVHDISYTSNTSNNVNNVDSEDGQDEQERNSEGVPNGAERVVPVHRMSLAELRIALTRAQRELETVRADNVQTKDHIRSLTETLVRTRSELADLRRAVHDVHEDAEDDAEEEFDENEDDEDANENESEKGNDVHRVNDTEAAPSPATMATTMTTPRTRKTTDLPAAVRSPTKDGHRGDVEYVARLGRLHRRWRARLRTMQTTLTALREEASMQHQRAMLQSTTSVLEQQAGLKQRLRESEATLAHLTDQLLPMKSKLAEYMAVTDRLGLSYPFAAELQGEVTMRLRALRRQTRVRKPQLYDNSVCA